jgi:hypothetical protein
MDLALYDRDGTLLAATARAPRIPLRRLEHAGWAVMRAGHVWILPWTTGVVLSCDRGIRPKACTCTC